MKASQKVVAGLGKAVGAGMLLAISTGWGAEADVSKLPPAASGTVDYGRDILPIFEKACFRCHGPERPKSGFRLDERGAALKGGENGVAIIPGKSAESPMIHYVAFLEEGMEMPPPGKADRLTAGEVGLLRAWIDQGVSYGAATNATQLKYAVTAGGGFISVSGDKGKFREHNWMREGWSGGLEHLTLQGRTKGGSLVTAEARAIAEQDDYLLKLRMEKRDLGFVQFGMEEYRRHTDGTGLWYPAYFPAASAGPDFGMAVGRNWVEAGLTLPDWPKLTVGYERQYRDGDKSSLQFDFVSPDISAPPVGDPQGRALLPTSRNLREEVHIFKFDLDHEVEGVRITDSFRGELYDLTSNRERIGSTVAGVRTGFNGAREREEADHFQAANAFAVEKQLRDWLFGSAGYLYSRMDGDADFERALFVPVNPAAPSFLGEDAQSILIEQESHAFNVNALLGPWDGLSFHGGFQNEWMRQKGLGTSLQRATLRGAITPDESHSDLSRMTFDESFGVKYTKIPATVVHADVRWQQEHTDLAEGHVAGLPDSDHDFFRDTDAKALLEAYRAGVTVSPWTKASWSADVKRRTRKTDYDHALDLDFGGDPGNGYPAFITEREIHTDSFETRVALRPAGWVRTTLKYELVSTEYRTTTARSMDDNGNPQPGGGLLAGNYDAHIYSVNAAMTPWRRWHLSGTLSYSRSRMVSGVNNNVETVPYEGDIYSALASATFAVSQKTDLHANYTFSLADYGQPSTGVNLPMGLAFDRHGVMAGLTHRWKPTLTTKVQYGFFRHNEPSSGQANNYEAHAVFVSMTCSVR